VALLAVLLLCVILAGMFVARQQIIAQWPATANYYAMVPFIGESLGAGLDIRGVKSERGIEDGVEVLEISGLIANIDEKSRDVPLIHIALYDANEEAVVDQTVEPSRSQLDPGDTIDFRVVLKDPPVTARKLEVTFFKR